jgi:pimeloyl-ACP methyl ester carboxylesterase
MFSTSVHKPEVHYYDTLGRTIRYVTLGADSLPTLLLVHGSPASLSSWKHLMRDTSLLKQVRLVLVDRPGYGYSGFGKPELSIAQQSALLSPLLYTSQNQQPLLLMGASYGGPVAARLAMDHPEAVHSLILLSASIAPKEEKIYHISYPANYWALRWAVPKTLRMANYEKLGHEAELNTLLPLWGNITANVLVIHGDADKLIYPPNAAFAKEKMQNAQVEVMMLPGMGHALEFTKPALIKKILFKHIERLIYSPSPLAEQSASEELYFEDEPVLPVKTLE